MKKVFSVVLSIIITLTIFNVNVKAAENAQVPKEIITYGDEQLYEIKKPSNMYEFSISEYDMYKQLKSAGDEFLKEQGWSKERISQFKNYDYVAELKQKATLSEQELKSQGYGEQQIKALKTDDWSEYGIQAKSAILQQRIGLSTTSDNNRTWNFYYEWAWSSRPSFSGSYIIGIRWVGSTNGSVCIPTLLSNSMSSVQMVDLDDGYKIIYTSHMEHSKVDLNAAQRKFKGYELWSQTPPNPTLRLYAMSGYGYIRLNNTTSMDRVTLGWKYGHSVKNVDPKLSITTSGASVAFTFSDGVSESASIIKSFSPNGSEVN